MAAGELAPGTLIGGDFRIESTLAQGGMGVVYVALQASTQKRRALKVMSPQPGDLDVVRMRFEREAHVASQIESDHVVQVIGAGVDGASKMAWLAMELLEGEDLDQYLTRRGRLDWMDAWNIAGEMCHALEAAHRIGIVHRDLKPSNVFLARSRRPGVEREVKVLDFGIAKRATDTSKTTGALGTPLYMAPEQTMTGGTLAAATDVWALGLMLFELLVGAPYWRSASTDGGQIATLLREIILEPLPLASTRAAELGGEGCLPPGFDAWFARCVDRDVAARFEDAHPAYVELARVFAAATGHHGAGVPPASVGRPLASQGVARRATPSTRNARTQPTFETTRIAPAPRSHLKLLIAGTVTGVAVAAAGALLVVRMEGGTDAPLGSALPQAEPPRVVAPAGPAVQPVAPSPPAGSAAAEVESEAEVPVPAPSASGAASASGARPGPRAPARPPRAPTSATPSQAPPAPPVAPPAPPVAPPAPPVPPPAARPPPAKDPVIL